MELLYSPPIPYHDLLRSRGLLVDTPYVSRDFGVPNQGYGVPNQGYGVPDKGHGIPNQEYGAPTTGYQAPSQHSSYESGAQGYGAPKEEDIIKQNKPSSGYSPPKKQSFQKQPSQNYGPPVKQQPVQEYGNQPPVQYGVPQNSEYSEQVNFGYGVPESFGYDDPYYQPSGYERPGKQKKNPYKDVENINKDEVGDYVEKGLWTVVGLSVAGALIAGGVYAYNMMSVTKRRRRSIDANTTFFGNDLDGSLEDFTDQVST